MQAAQVFAVIGDQPLDRQIDFPDQQTVRELVDHRAQTGHDRVHARQIR